MSLQDGRTPHVLVRVNPILTGALLLAISAACLSGALYIVRRDNDPGFWLASRAMGRYAMGALGFTGATVALFNFVTQVRHRFVWAVGTDEGVHAAMTPRGGLPPLRVPGPPRDIVFTEVPLRWNRRLITFENKSGKLGLTVWASKAAEARQRFEEWVANSS